MLKEYVDFGCGVLWTGRRRGFGPYFNARSLHASWWSGERGRRDRHLLLQDDAAGVAGAAALAGGRRACGRTAKPSATNRT
jgi:hypothetical protein